MLGPASFSLFRVVFVLILVGRYYVISGSGCVFFPLHERSQQTKKFSILYIFCLISATPTNPCKGFGLLGSWQGNGTVLAAMR